MKKIFSFLLACVVSACLFACVKKVNINVEKTTEATTELSTEVNSETTTKTDNSKNDVLSVLIQKYLDIKSGKMNDRSKVIGYPNYKKDCKMDSDGSLYEYESYDFENYPRVETTETLIIYKTDGTNKTYEYSNGAVFQTSGEMALIDGIESDKNEVLNMLNYYKNMVDSYNNFNVKSSTENSSNITEEKIVEYEYRPGDVIKEVIPFKYDSAASFSEGLALVKLNDKWGYIDKTCKEVIPCIYENSFNFGKGEDDLAAVRFDNKTGYVDKKGNVVIPFIYDGGWSFSEGLAGVRLNGKMGYIDKNGNVVIPFKYDQAEMFRIGLGEVKLNGKWGFVDKNGTEVIPCIYDSILLHESSEYLTAILNGKNYYFDKTGKEITRRDYFSEGLAINYLNNKYGFKDKNGNEIIPCIYDMAYDFHDGLALVKLNDKRGYIDKTGKEVIPIIYDGCWSFTEGLSGVQLNGKWGFIDKTGKEVVPFIYDNARGFSEGLAPVQLNGKWGYISYLSGRSAGNGGSGQSSNNDDYYYVNGNKATNTWAEGHYYGEDGKMYRNRRTPDGKFVNRDGDVVDIKKDFEEIDKNEVEANAWFKTKNGIWYYFTGDRTTLKKGWFVDPQDEQTYYLDPETGIMLTGWQKIDGKEYYFNESHDNEPNWYYVAENDTYESYGKKVKAYGSMFKDEVTPDGFYVDKNGVKGAQEYIFPDSDKRLLTPEEVMFLDDSLLRYAINEIYARHGRIFKDTELNNYFTSKSWYHGLYDNDHFDESCLSDIEFKNIDLMVNAKQLK